MRTVEHQAVVAIGPGRRARDLFADEAVLCGEQVIRERVPVKHVAELVVEGRPLVVAHLEESVFDAEGIVKVLTELMLGELDGPVREIAAIE